MKNIQTIRKTVAIMANQLHKLGYSLSQAFKTAWRRVKKSMTCRVSGVTYENRQQLLKYINGRKSKESHNKRSVSILRGHSFYYDF